MGFWIARARRFGGRALVATLACLIVGASAASAVSVSLPTSIAISAVSQNTSVNMTIGTVSNLEALAVSFTYDSSIVSVPDGGRDRAGRLAWSAPAARQWSTSTMRPCRDG